MKKTFLLIIILLFFLIPEGIAQYGFRKGFVIASEKDTIYGELDYRSNLSNNKSCLFRKGSVVTEYKPSQILGYGFTGGRYFTSQIIKGTFVEVLVKGELSLFKSGFDLYVQKINNEPLRLESKIIRETVETKVEGERNESVVYREDVRWKGLLSALTSDCIESSNAIQVLKLDEKNLTRFVIDYNLCKGSGYTDYKSKLPWTKFEYGITAGLAVSSIKTKNKPYNFEYLDDIYQSVNPTFGVQLVVSSPRIYEKIVLETGLYYIKSSFHSQVVKEKTGEMAYYDTYINFSSLSLPISLRYIFPGRNYTLFLSGGLDIAYILNSDSKLLSEIQSGNTVDSYESDAFTINKVAPGLSGEIGVIRSLQHFRIGTTLRYYSSNRYNTERTYDSNLGRISLSIIISGK